MLDQLRHWINGSREYTSGVILYLHLGNNEALKKLLKKTKTDYNVKRLQQELQAICVQLKNETVDEEKIIITDQPVLLKVDDPTLPANGQLYDACHQEATKKYKEAMNARAVLFNMIPANEYADPNQQDFVLQRSDLAIKVVDLYNEASYLFDRAAYVKEHGKLQDAPPANDAIDMELIPEYQVKQHLDNRRKNYNKLLKKENNPETVLKIQQHEKDIKILERRWHLLTQEK